MTEASCKLRRLFRSPSFWLAVTIGILLYAVWSNAKDRPLVVRNAQIEFCNTVTKPASKDAAARDRDIAIFARAAAEARRGEGQLETARVYEGVVERSKMRETAAEKRAQIPCEVRFPKP